MIRGTVMYPNVEGGRFDADVFLTQYVPLVRERWGKHMRQLTVTKGLAGRRPGAPPPYHFLLQVDFAGMDELGKAIAESAETLEAAIPTFTDQTPVVQIGQVLD